MKEHIETVRKARENLDRWLALNVDCPDRNISEHRDTFVSLFDLRLISAALAKIEAEHAELKQDWYDEREFIEEIEEWIGADHNGSVGSGIHTAIKALRARVEQLTTTLRELRCETLDMEPDAWGIKCIEDHNAIIDEALAAPEQKEPAQPPAPMWAEVRSGLTDVLTGGNHLAGALIHYLGTGKGFPPYSMSHDKAFLTIKDPLHYDLWCCWRSIMHMREALLSRIPQGEETKG